MLKMFQLLGDFIPSLIGHFHELPEKNEFDFFE